MQRHRYDDVRALEQRQRLFRHDAREAGADRSPAVGQQRHAEDGDEPQQCQQLQGPLHAAASEPATGRRRRFAPQAPGEEELRREQART